MDSELRETIDRMIASTSKNASESAASLFDMESGQNTKLLG